MRRSAIFRSKGIALRWAPFDRRHDVEHPRDVVFWYRRFAAVLCVLALTPSVWVECAGWLATPEARRSCCESADCPMHKDDAASARVVTQAEADRCCAASDSDESSPSSTPFALSITFAVLQPGLPVVAPEPVTFSLQTPEGVGLRASPVPKHLLLSVFLV